MKSAVQSRAKAILNAMREESGDAEAAAKFESDMAPICEAVATAIRAKDLAAFEGLKAMFAPMLADANAEPALAQVMQRQIGAALLKELTS
jgi:phage gp29-like protein